MPCVIADTSPLSYLAQLDRLDLLSGLFEKVLLPASVWEEATAGRQRSVAAIPRLLAAHANGTLDVVTKGFPELPAAPRGLHRGEHDAIRLALHLAAERVLMDDAAGRVVAEGLGLRITGTLGVLILAKQRGLLRELAPELYRLRRETTFRFSPALEREILRQASETQHPK